jgi:hypothetical protein
VVHDRDLVEAGRFGRLGNSYEVIGQRLGAAGPIEDRHV